MKTSLLSLSLTLTLVQLFFFDFAPPPFFAPGKFFPAWAVLEAVLPLSAVDACFLAYETVKVLSEIPKSFSIKQMC